MLNQMEQLINKQKYQQAIDLGLQVERDYLMNPEEMDSNQTTYLSILNKLSDIYLELNNPSQALKYLVTLALTLKKQPKIDYLMLGGLYAKIGRSSTIIKGKACFFSCHYDYSAQFLKMAKLILEEHHLEQSNEMGMTLVQLGNYYRFMFQDDEAQKLLQQSIQIRLELFGQDSIEVAESYHGLAQLFTDMGNLQDAHEKIDEAIYIVKQKMGPKHIRTAKSLYLKGNLLMRRHPPDNQLAQELINESLSINLEIVGENFLETADCYHSLGKIKSQNLKSEEYLEVKLYILCGKYFQKALSILEKIYGKAHASIAILLNNLGKAQFDRKKYEDAVQCFSRSIQIYKQICGSVHGNLAITLKSSADCHKHLGRLKEAHDEYRQSLQIYEQIETDFNSTKKQIKKLLTETETED